MAVTLNLSLTCWATSFTTFWTEEQKKRQVILGPNFATTQQLILGPNFATKQSHVDMVLL
jgi:hypothetical protein